MLSKYKSTRTTYFTRILALPILFVLIAAFTFKAKEALQATALEGDKEFVVVVDAGHGGQDGGAKAEDGTFEKDLNLALAKKIKELNTNDRIKIILTRETDIYQKPKEKADIANKLNADLFISVHVSNTPEKLQNVSTGMEVYVAKDDFANSASSKVFASAIINTFASNYKLKVKSNPQQSKTGIWVLQESNCPAILIEAGFISNNSDKAYLTSAAGKEAFAGNVLSAINKYVNEVVNGTIENLQPSRSEAKVTTMLKDYKNDTLPKNNSSSEVTIIDDAQFIIDKLDAEGASQHAIVVIGEKIYDVKALNNKMIAGKRAKLYGKGNKMIIEKYGKRAKDGAIIFEEGVIKDLPTGKYDVVIDRANQSQFTDASQRLNEKSVKLNEEKKNLTDRSIIVNKRLDSVNSPLYVLDGKKINLSTLKGLDPTLIKSINILKGETAELQYGVEAKNGAILIATKKPEALDVEGKKLELTKLNGSLEEVVVDGNKLSPTVKQTNPEITLSGISTNRISVSRLKDIKSVQISLPGYKIMSGTVFFSGAGFPYVTTASLYGESLEHLAIFLKRVQAGTSITFDNVVIEDAKGNRSAIGKGFTFFASHENSIQP